MVSHEWWKAVVWLRKIDFNSYNFFEATHNFINRSPLEPLKKLFCRHVLADSSPGIRHVAGCWVDSFYAMKSLNLWMILQTSWSLDRSEPNIIMIDRNFPVNNICRIWEWFRDFIQFWCFRLWKTALFHPKVVSRTWSSEVLSHPSDETQFGNSPEFR